jgi:hypothetical protein
VEIKKEIEKKEEEKGCWSQTEDPLTTCVV